MEISEKRRILNELYHPLELKRAELVHALLRPMFELSSGFYNGHYRETPEGSWQMDFYPIPVISVKGLCDIEIDFDGVSISTKKKRQDALEYPFEKLGSYSFESFGVEDYLQTYYKDGMSLAAMKQSISQSAEEEIGFCFPFPADADSKSIFKFVKLLRRDGFYY